VTGDQKNLIKTESCIFHLGWAVNIGKAGPLLVTTCRTSTACTTSTFLYQEYYLGTSLEPSSTYFM